jgi:exonuclease SbcC
MIPIRLQLAGFLSYRTAVEIDFTSFELACISGPNGAGKSSLLDAVTWALFGKARKHDDALIHHDCPTAQVYFEFEYEGDVYRVQRTKSRGKTTLLEWQMQTKGGEWSALTESSVRETEASIERILRMDYDTFINTSFFLQGKADQFAQQTPGRRKEILSSILGLEIWERYREVAANLKRQSETELSGLATRLGEIEQELGEEADRIQYLKQQEENLSRQSALRREKELVLDGFRQQRKELDEQRRAGEQLDQQVAEYQAKLVQIHDQLGKRQQELEGYQQAIQEEKEIVSAHQRWQELHAELERLNQLELQVNQLEKKRLELAGRVTTEQARLEQELKALLDGQEKIRLLEPQIAGSKGRLAELQDQVKELGEVSRSKADLETQLRQSQMEQAELIAESKRLEKLIKEIRSNIDSLKDSKQSNCPLCRQPISAQDRQRLLDEWKAQGEALAREYQATRQRWESITRQVEEMNQQMAKYDAQLKQLSAFEKGHAAEQAKLEQYLEENSRWQEQDALKLDEMQKVLKGKRFCMDEQQEIAKLDKEIQVLKYDSAKHQEIKQQEGAEQGIEQRYNTLQQARSALLPLQREMDTYHKQAGDLEKEIHTKQAESQQLKGKFQRESAALPDTVQLEEELQQVRDEENQLQRDVGAAQQRVAVLEVQKKRKQDLLLQREEFATRIAHLEQLERAFGKNGVPALLIEQALPEIESRANQILDRLSAGNMSLRFETQRERRSKSGEGAIQTLDILISDAIGMREYELFSGGEAFRINFALRLALAYVLAHRAGARLQTLVIDEGFSSQDADGLQRLIEAIHLVMEPMDILGGEGFASDIRKILVITHMEELKDAFPARIEVEKTVKGSQVQVLA